MASTSERPAPRRIGGGARAIATYLAVFAVFAAGFSPLCLGAKTGASQARGQGHHDDMNRLELWRHLLGGAAFDASAASPALLQVNQTTVPRSGDFVRVYLPRPETKWNEEHLASETYVALFQGEAFLRAKAFDEVVPIKWKKVRDPKTGHALDSRR